MHVLLGVFLAVFISVEGGTIGVTGSLDGLWYLKSQDIRIATSQSGMFNNVHLPNNSIIEVDWNIITNMQRLHIISHQSEIHFNFQTEQLTLKPNQTINFLEFSNNKKFEFGGFSKILFKGKCEKWLVDFSEIFSQENHTIKFGESRMDNMIAIKSQERLFADVYLEVLSELEIKGGDSNEKMEIHGLNTNVERPPKLKIDGGNGIDHTVMFPATIGAYGCPLDVNDDLITINAAVTCIGSQTITIRGDTIVVQPSARLQSDLGDITVAQRTASSNGDCEFHSTLVSTLGNFILDCARVYCASTTITATQSITIQHTGPFSTSPYPAVRIASSMLFSQQITILGESATSVGVSIQNVQFNNCQNLNIRGTSDALENGLEISVPSPGINVAGPVIVEGQGGLNGINYDIPSLDGTSVSISGTKHASSADGAGVKFLCIVPGGCDIRNLNNLQGTGDLVGIDMSSINLRIATAASLTTIQTQGTFVIDQSTIGIDARLASSVDFAIAVTTNTNGLYLSSSTLILQAVPSIEISAGNTVHEFYLVDSSITATDGISAFKINANSQVASFGMLMDSPILSNVNIEVFAATQLQFVGAYDFDSVSLIFHSCTNVIFVTPTFIIINYLTIELDDTNIIYAGQYTGSVTAVYNLRLSGFSNVDVNFVTFTGFQLVNIATVGAFTGQIAVNSATVSIGADVSLTVVSTAPSLDFFVAVSSVIYLGNVNGIITCTHNAISLTGVDLLPAFSGVDWQLHLTSGGYSARFQSSSLTIGAGMLTISSQGPLTMIDTSIEASSVGSINIQTNTLLELQGSTSIFAHDESEMTLTSNLLTFSSFVHPPKSGGFINFLASLQGDTMQFGTGAYLVSIFGVMELSSSFIAENNDGAQDAYSVVLSLDTTISSTINGNLLISGGLRLQGSIYCNYMQFMSFVNTVEACNVNAPLGNIHFAGKLGLQSPAQVTVSAGTVDLDDDITHTANGRIVFVVSGVLNSRSSAWTAFSLGTGGRGWVNFIINILITVPNYFAYTPLD